MNDLSFGAKALIASVGDDDGPTPADRERVRRALLGAIAASAAVAATAGSASAGALGAAAAGSAGAVVASGVAPSLLAGKLGVSAVAWLLGGALAGSLAMAPVVLSSSALPASGASSVRSAQAASRPAHAPRADGAVAAERRELELPAPALGVERAPAASRGASAQLVPAPEARPTPEPPPALGLGSEVALLQSAQRALASSDPARALALLEQHAARFASGALVAERLAARVFALCDLGRVEEARAAAREFLRGAPESPLVPRVTASCAAEP